MPCPAMSTTELIATVQLLIRDLESIKARAAATRYSAEDLKELATLMKSQEEN